MIGEDFVGGRKKAAAKTGIEILERRGLKPARPNVLANSLAVLIWLCVDELLTNAIECVIGDIKRSEVFTRQDTYVPERSGSEFFPLVLKVWRGTFFRSAFETVSLMSQNSSMVQGDVRCCADITSPRKCFEWIDAS